MNEVAPVSYTHLDVYKRQTWGKNLDHYYYGNLASGTPETADFEIVAEDGMGNTYRTSKLQTDFIGF